MMKSFVMNALPTQYLESDINAQFVMIMIYVKSVKRSPTMNMLWSKSRTPLNPLKNNFQIPSSLYLIQ